MAQGLAAFGRCITMPRNGLRAALVGLSFASALALTGCEASVSFSGAQDKKPTHRASVVPSESTDPSPAVATETAIPVGIPVRWQENWCDASTKNTVKEVIALMGEPTSVGAGDGSDGGTEYKWEAKEGDGQLMLTVGTDEDEKKNSTGAYSMALDEEAVAPFDCPDAFND